MDNNRLAYIKRYFAEQEKVKVEIAPFISKTAKETVIRRFNGIRYGYKFKDGIAWVNPKDLHLFTEKHFNIHDGKEDK